ncbi:MAG: hypothetical protein ABGX25_00080 [Nautiliaceae bacterium]
MKKSLIFILPLILFLGCADKNVFKPQKVVKKRLSYEKKDTVLVDYTHKALTFQKEKGFLNKKVEYFDENGKSLGSFEKLSENLAVNGDTLLLLDSKQKIKLPYLVYRAYKKDNLIAVVFENNAEGVYDLKKNKLVFYKENEPVLVAKYLGVAPIFYKDLILFPLLNGNISVVDANSLSFIRNLSLGENIINNIIFLKIVNHQLFMATPNKLVLFNPNFLVSYDGDIKHILTDGKDLYVFFVGGKIIRFDSDLKKLKETKLDFADYFAPTVCNGYIYTVTSNGYLIKIDRNLKTLVFKTNKFKTDEPLKMKGCKIYNDNKVFIIE